MEVGQIDACWTLLRPVVLSDDTARLHSLVGSSFFDEASVFRLNTLNLREDPHNAQKNFILTSHLSPFINSSRHHTDSGFRNVPGGEMRKETRQKVNPDRDAIDGF